jgi:hypothetical protein
MTTECRGRIVLLTFIILLVAGSTHAQSSNWPRWRGPEGTGHSSETALPVEWDEQGIAWRTELPGDGHSSPIVWGEKVFVTASQQTEDGQVARLVVAVDRRTGKILWKQVASTTKAESSHKMNGWAAATCTTDGECVIASFGVGGIHCFDMAGKNVWSKFLGDFAGPWGTAASPVIVGDLVIQNCDAEQKASLIALDKRSGEIVWQTDRQAIRGWSTPIMLNVGGHDQLILNGHHGVQAYEPKTGEELWFCKSAGGRGTATVAPAGDLLVAICGSGGEVYAIRQGGKGDISQSHKAWGNRRGGGRDLPSPLVMGDLVFVVNMRGIGTIYEAASGNELWKERIGGNVCSSPIAAAGLIYTQNEAGEIFVIRPGKKLDIVAHNKLGDRGDEIFRSSLAASGGCLFTRSDRALYCIGKSAP